MNRASQAVAATATLGATWFFLNDDYATFQSETRHEQRQVVANFLQLCTNNQVVTTQQQLEKFATYGGSPIGDPYTQAFKTYLKS